MKKYLIQLACLLSLFFLFSCGDSEDALPLIGSETDPLLRIKSLVEQLEDLKIGVPKDWELTRDPVWYYNIRSMKNITNVLVSKGGFVWFTNSGISWF